MKIVWNQSGQTLIEVLVALGAAVVIVTAITVSVVTSLSSAQFSKNQNLGTHYAQEGLELVRQIRDSDWATFITYEGIYCVGEDKQLQLSAAECATGNIGSYLRQVEIRQISSACENQPGVVSTVKWADGKCKDRSKPYCHEVVLSTCFTNINKTVLP